MTEVATNDPYLVNNYGQDIEFRIAPDAKNKVAEWCPLAKGAQTTVAAPPDACTLEIRVTLRQPLEGPLETIEVTRNLRVKCREHGEPEGPPPRKNRSTKPGGPKNAKGTKRPAKPTDGRGRAAAS